MNNPLKFLYFDTAATTLVAPEVLARMVESLSSEDGYANPSSIAHLPGQAAAAVEAARAEIAAELGCEADEVIFTSGATEANNLALRWLMRRTAAIWEQPSTSANTGRLLAAMLHAADQEDFGIEKSPTEKSLYLSSLKASGLHRKKGERCCST